MSTESDYLNIQEGKVVNNNNNQKEKSSGNCGNICIGSLLFVNTVILALVLVYAISAYQELDSKTQPILELVDIFNAPKPNPKVVKSLSALVTETMSNVFFFGSETGTVPTFVKNLLATDFADIAQTASSFGHSVMNAFENNLNPAVCQGPTIDCPNQGTFSCPNGNTVNCYYQGQQRSCANASCINQNVVTVASWIVSIAEPLKGWKTVNAADGGVTNTNSSSAAFSSGVFRLDELFNWAKAQMNYGDWQAAARNCNQFSYQLRSINWNGTYFNTNGHLEHWEANKGVNDAMDYVDQICSSFTSLDKAHKASPHHPHQHQAAPHQKHHHRAAHKHHRQ